MKKITRFQYVNQGVNYRGVLAGHLSRDGIQLALLTARKGCAEIWGIEHVLARA